MVVQGQVKNGIVVPDSKTPLPEGAVVRIEIVDPEAELAALRLGLLSLAGRAKGLPEDAAENHDKYLDHQDLE